MAMKKKFTSEKSSVISADKLAGVGRFPFYVFLYLNDIDVK